ncbi:Nuclear hormone receptor family member nhr-57 [Caenorhabditis elegans]|uniref:Nuclear hormone receptor family member nhr-57 n=4 Tax=Caenorhabditis elegans TaxID=6239 RepID=NHR57_CAEEL|nr:Nuclear hormone receptor family member nhr-57 [Caenorhabditis elegans]O16425.1 RecName: Full=Nuclear hormone receptor family member nhr-57 [Caenorhabditis elegans]CCD70827.1 Nuclear hormone receptor family member nhr-57 [Caenorhabditis elegans]|eukprot:NP_504153.1 Nuclear hormone receptor family member nhr-57 [Caenorhabditis elegans]
MLVARERKYCSVCHQLGDGYHFGAIACKACAAFFRRTTSMNLAPKFVCRKKNECVIKMSSRDSCKSCRYAKCLHVGMNPEVVQAIQQAAKQANSPGIESLPSCSSSPASCNSPILSLELGDYDQMTPTLCGVMESYQKLYKKRYDLHAPKLTPRATNYGEFCKIYSNDVYLQFEFLEGSFPQFKEMGGFEKKHVFKYFFVSFLILEMGYRSYQEGTDAIVLANGDFIDTMNLDEFYYDPESLEKCKPTDAMKMYRPNFDQMKRNVFQPLSHQKLSLIEFLALVSLCTWNESLDGQPDCYYPSCRPVRQSVIADLKAFYEKDSPDVDPAYRLSGLLMLLPALERSVELFLQTMEVKRLFRCFPFHDKIYKIIDGQ